MDVGGTLLPNTLNMTATLADERAKAVSSVLGSEAARAASIIEEIEIGLRFSPEVLPDRVIARVLVKHNIDTRIVTATQVRHAMCVGLAGAHRPFDHAGLLLGGIDALGLRCVVLSNTTLRDAEMYRRDFAALGWGAWVDAYVTSVDVGFSKPDERIFASALAVSGSDSRQCVMVGNSEHADIEPAVRLGMRTILVAIEDPLPATTAADACVTGLDQVLELIRGWTEAAAPPIT